MTQLIFERKLQPAPHLIVKVSTNEAEGIKIGLNDEGVIEYEGARYMYKYKDGLLVSSGYVSSDTKEILEYRDGLLFMRYKNGIRDHYLHNVFVGQTKDSTPSIVPIVLRGRTRAEIVSNNNGTDIVVLDMSLFDLIREQAKYVEASDLMVPFTFDAYMKYYASKLPAPGLHKPFIIEDIHFTKLEDVMDGKISYAKDDLIYNAIVTDGILEEETVSRNKNKMMYVYTQGGILEKVFLDGVELYVSDGLIVDEGYYKGLLHGVVGGRIYYMGEDLGPTIPATKVYNTNWGEVKVEGNDSDSIKYPKALRLSTVHLDRELNAPYFNPDNSIRHHVHQHLELV